MRGVVRAGAAGLGSLLLAGCASAAGGTAAPNGVATPTATPDLAARSPSTARMAAARTPMSQLRAYRPTWLAMPSGLVVPVEPADVGVDGKLEIPDDPARAGWWSGGALVDEPFGSVVIAGHVDSRTYGIGAMSELLDLAIGDAVVVGDADSVRTYRVDEIRQVPKANLSADTDAFRQDVAHRLVLITCVGRFNPVGGYTDNLVVFATPAS